MRSERANQGERLESPISAKSLKDSVLVLGKESRLMWRLHVKFPHEGSERFHIDNCFAYVLYSGRLQDLRMAWFLGGEWFHEGMRHPIRLEMCESVAYMHMRYKAGKISSVS